MSISVTNMLKLSVSIAYVVEIFGAWRSVPNLFSGRNVQIVFRHEGFSTTSVGKISEALRPIQDKGVSIDPYICAK